MFNSQSLQSHYRTSAIHKASACDDDDEKKEKHRRPTKTTYNTRRRTFARRDVQASAGEFGTAEPLGTCTERTHTHDDQPPPPAFASRNPNTAMSDAATPTNSPFCSKSGVSNVNSSSTVHEREHSSCTSTSTFGASATVYLSFALTFSGGVGHGGQN